jgi:CRISPR-associated endonuclease/helicase Cas3
MKNCSENIGQYEQLPSVLRCWGKSGEALTKFHPAVFHMLDVGNIARALLNEQSSPRWRWILAKVLNAEPETLIEWIPWFIAIHDIGKISLAFQEQHPLQRDRLISEGFPLGKNHWHNEPVHPLIGLVFVDQEGGGEFAPPKLRQAWAEMIGSHHGQFQPLRQGRETFQQLKTKGEPAEWPQLRIRAAETLKKVLLAHPLSPWPEPDNLSAATMTLTGFTILCDWLGSDEKYFPMSADTDWNDYLEKSTRQAQQAVEAAGFWMRSRSTASNSFRSLFPDLQPPRSIQKTIDDIPKEYFSGPCLAILEAPAGEGKTEAALALAHHLAGSSGTDELYYALPTTATSNQMFGRLQRYIRESLGLPIETNLVHGQAFLVKDDHRLYPMNNGEGTPRRAELEWFGPKKKALLAPFGVGTIDQAELAALNVRHTALRMLGLAGKVLIVDEVHAYDTYMTTIVERLLNWLAEVGTSVILLSATLPLERRANLIKAYTGNSITLPETDDAYPCLWVISRNGKVHRAAPAAYQAERTLAIQRIHFGDADAEAKAQWLLQAVSDGGCASWITNTVDRAQKIYAILDQIAPSDVNRILLHARMPLDERQRRELDLTTLYGRNGANRPFRGIVVGTQVLEQSLDIDFDVMVSNIAPVDLLLQRAGRMHRHERPRPPAHKSPCLWINTEQDSEGGLFLSEADKAIYDEYILRQTELVLYDRSSLKLPSDYRALIQAVYASAAPLPHSPLAEAWENLQDKESNATGKARQRILPPPDPEDSFCGPLAARVTFEENENSAAWVVAQTRLGEEGLTVIPLEKEGEKCWCVVDGIRIEAQMEEEAPRDIQLQLLRHSLSLSNVFILRALHEDKSNLPRLFTDSALLKNCMPIWLQKGEGVLAWGKISYGLRMDPTLGLLLERRKENR